MIQTLDFDGYRSFPSRRQYDRKQPFQSLALAPLTLIIGRNNAGKTSVATLLHQVLAGLAGSSAEPLPLAVAGIPVADTFQDLLAARDLSAFLELDVTLAAPRPHRLETILYLAGLLDDERPRTRHLRWDGQACATPDEPLQGLPLPIGAAGEAIRAEAVRTLYNSVWLGPLRRPTPASPSRQRPQPDRPPIGVHGERVVDLLADDDAVFDAVAAWFTDHAGFSLRWERNLDLLRLQAVRGGARSIPIAQVGSGVHQLLPVLALAQLRARAMCSGPFIDVVQQPELHLHDALHPMLGDLFLDVARTDAGITVVETHAEGLLLRVRRRIAEGVSPDLVALYYVDDAPEGSSLRRIGITSNGEVDFWPAGVFLESYEEVKALRRAQRQRGG
jgi:hypothetical protein